MPEKPKQHEDGICDEAMGLDGMAHHPGRLSDAINDVILELQSAGMKFETWPDDLVHGAAIVAEEAGELVQAALQDVYENGDVGAMRKEAIQTAAMALRFLVNLPEE